MGSMPIRGLSLMNVTVVVYLPCNRLLVVRIELICHHTPEAWPLFNPSSLAIHFLCLFLALLVQVGPLGRTCPMQPSNE